MVGVGGTAVTFSKADQLSRPCASSLINSFLILPTYLSIHPRVHPCKGVDRSMSARNVGAFVVRVPATIYVCARPLRTQVDAYQFRVPPLPALAYLSVPRPSSSRAAWPSVRVQNSIHSINDALS